jgi:hypothetical protein
MKLMAGLASYIAWVSSYRMSLRSSKAIPGFTSSESTEVKQYKEGLLGKREFRNMQRKYKNTSSPERR